MRIRHLVQISSLHLHFSSAKTAMGEVAYTQNAVRLFWHLKKAQGEGNQHHFRVSQHFKMAIAFFEVATGLLSHLVWLPDPA